MFNDLDWTRKGYEEKCIPNFEDVKIYAKRFSKRHWKFLDPEDGEKCYGIWKPQLQIRKMVFRRFWDDTTIPDNWTSNVHGCQCLGSWNPEKSERKETIHSLRMSRTKNFLFRIIHSVNKLSIHGAVSNWSGQHGESLNETEPTWEKFNDERRLHKSGNNEECEFTGSKLFRGFFVIESCFWKQIVRGSSEFCFSIRIHSNDDKKLRTSIIWKFEDSWYVS